MHEPEQSGQPQNQTTPATVPVALAWLRGLAGAAAGGAAGYFIFDWLLGHGLYAIALPGALLGLGAGLASGRKSIPLGVVCAVLALLWGLFTQWRFQVPNVDPSFSYFLTHANQLNSVTQVMIGLGALMALWFGVGRDRTR